MKVPGSKIVPCQGVLGSNHSLTFGLFTQVSGSGPLGPLVELYLCLLLVMCHINFKEIQSRPSGTITPGQKQTYTLMHIIISTCIQGIPSNGLGEVAITNFFLLRTSKGHN